jgi:hypothetical protein
LHPGRTDDDLLEILDAALERKDAALRVALDALVSYSESGYIKHQHPIRFKNGTAAITTIKEAL